MIIDVFWDDVKILSVEKVSGYYISTIIKENILAVKKSGFPLYFLKDISVMSEELPNIIKNRVKNIGSQNGKIKFKDNEDKITIDEEKYKYINETECRRPTDKLSINIQI